MKRHNSHSRKVAWVFVAFYAVAAVRSLIPGLCATLAPMEMHASVDECCQFNLIAGDEISEGHVEAGTCALCNLTESTSQTTTEVVAPVPHILAEQTIAKYESPTGQSALWSPLSHRGPPAIA